MAQTVRDEAIRIGDLMVRGKREKLFIVKNSYTNVRGSTETGWLFEFTKHDSPLGMVELEEMVG